MGPKLILNKLYLLRVQKAAQIQVAKTPFQFVLNKTYLTYHRYSGAEHHHKTEIHNRRPRQRLQVVCAEHANLKKSVCLLAC
jgi:hypothetical protein